MSSRKRKRSAVPSAAKEAAAPSAPKTSPPPAEDRDDSRYLWLCLMPAALLVLALCSLARFHWAYLYERFQTYPSDIWYIYSHYGWFIKNRPFIKIEYPAAMLVLFKCLAAAADQLPGAVSGKGVGTLFPIRSWFIVNTVFLSSCALALVWFTHQLNRRYLHMRRSAVLWGLALTPSFLFFSVFNYDVVPVLCCAAGLYCFLEKDRAGACAVLGLGCAFKVFPGLLFPLFWLIMPSADRWRAALSFLLPILILNVPFMICDWDKWIFPYVWQAGYDNSEQTGHLVYHLTQAAGKLPALLLMAAVMGFFLYRGWKRRPADCAENAFWLVRSSLVLLASFIMLKNVFSPQYLLWLSPFLAFSGAYPFYGVYTLIELMSGLEVGRLFFWQRHYPGFIVCCRICRDLGVALIWIYTVRQLLAPHSAAPPGKPPESE